MLPSNSITGVGDNNTFEIFGAYAANLLPSIDKVVNVQSIVLDAPIANADFNTITNIGYTFAKNGVSNYTFDDVSKLNGKTITTGPGQSLGLSTGSSNLGAASDVTWAASAKDASLTLILNGYQGDPSATPAGLTVNGAAAATTMNIVSSVDANAIGSFTGPTTVTKHVITGDQGFKYVLDTPDVAAVTTIDASAATGGVKADVSGGTIPAAFAFKGGTGDDTLSLKIGALALLTSGSQLTFGAGTDKLIIAEKSTLTSDQATKIIAATGLEVLGFSGNTSGADATFVPGITHFSVEAGNLSETFTNVAAGSMFDIDNSTGNTGTISIAGATPVTVNIDAKDAASSVTVTALTFFSPLLNPTINSLGVSSSASDANTIAGLTQPAGGS
ncbi:MAG: hypothetical protein WCK49_04405, partial [Myxococcaceae bacterium]